MTDGKPEPTPAERVTAAMDEFMATVLRHLRTGQGSPLGQLGLEKAREDCSTGARMFRGQEQNQGKHDQAQDHSIEHQELAGAERAAVSSQRGVAVQEFLGALVELLGVS
jgi:hypothetical protein